MLIWIFFFLFGWSSFALEEGEVVYLWKGKNSLIDQTVSIPQPLIIINYTQPEPSTPFQNINRFLTPPHLDGKVCSAYTFRNINSSSNQVAVDVNDKSLAFLILNSSPLRIKDISLAE